MSDTETEFFTDEIPKGNVSLRLKSVRTEDKGVYMCQVSGGGLSVNTTVIIERLAFFVIGIIPLFTSVFKYFADSGRILRSCWTATNRLTAQKGIWSVVMITVNAFMISFYIMVTLDYYEVGRHSVFVYLFGSVVVVLLSSTALMRTDTEDIVRKTAVPDPGLSSGAIAGIVFGVLVPVLLLAVAALALIYYRRRISKLKKQVESDVDSRFDAVDEHPSQQESDGAQDHDGGAHDCCSSVKLSEHKNKPQDILSRQRK
ncbi:butyrophilin 2 [Labeo rohita]|uniref:Butyrophilin 2 n=1 Tax=Labeo rohita TaxID=84645 RepID=A0A498MUL9_LABRO|nr:butyrophilin 2 [Labeo rohita]